MDEWRPISEEALLARIEQGRVRMSGPELNLWEAIRILPQKWNQVPYGNEGCGFWVVGIIGTTVLWYNDIEDGFNRSRLTAFGTIDDYWCNQDELEVAVRDILNTLNHGHDLLRFFDTV